MTECIILGEPNGKKVGNPIEFKKVLNDKGEITLSYTPPSAFKYIELVSRDYGFGFDLMFAYENAKDRVGNLYFGKWNDGFVK